LLRSACVGLGCVSERMDDDEEKEKKKKTQLLHWFFLAQMHF
jgi:hypothetical protein